MQKKSAQCLKKRTAVEIYFVHSAPIAAPQCKFISTAVQILSFFSLCFFALKGLKNCPKEGKNEKNRRSFCRSAKNFLFLQYQTPIILYTMNRKNINTWAMLLALALLTFTACTQNKNNATTTETEQTEVSTDDLKTLAEALPQYEQVYGFHEGLACVMRDGKYGFIDKTGQEVIPCQYVSIIHDFQEGLACMGIGDEQCVFIDRQGNVAFEMDKKY